MRRLQGLCRDTRLYTFSDKVAVAQEDKRITAKSKKRNCFFIILSIWRQRYRITFKILFIFITDITTTLVYFIKNFFNLIINILLKIINATFNITI